MKRLLPLLLSLFLLAGCTGGEEAATPVSPQEPDRSAACKVCGMTVVDYPGPKAQIFLKGEEKPAHFCSTRDFFGYILEEDSPQAHRIRAMYVQDMGVTDWEKPHEGETAWIPAKEALYVVGSDRGGAMGPTLASFASEKDAQAFADEHGGELMRFGEIDQELVVDLPGGGAGPGMAPKRRQ